MSDGLLTQDGTALREQLLRKEVSAVELVSATLERISTVNPVLNAFTFVAADTALEAARSTDDALSRGIPAGPLHGLPVGVKDVYDVAGMPNTAGSKIYADRVAATDSAAVARLKDAGAIVVGMTNTHEFALGGTTDNPHTGATLNPWDLTRIPAGSSGGSGSAVAADLCALALGGDAGGSIRQPAAVAGLVGLKPGFGTVPMAGIQGVTWTLDHLGPMTKSARDAWLVHEVLVKAESHHSDPGEQGLSDLRIGIPRRYFFDQMQQSVRDAVESAIVTFDRLGAQLVDIDIAHIEHAIPVWYAILLTEASARHGKLLETNAGDFGEDVRTLLEMGRHVTGVQYVSAQRARVLVRQGFDAAFAQVDALLTPTLPFYAPKRNQLTVSYPDGTEEPFLDAIGRYTLPANLTGLPAVAFCCGYEPLLGLPLSAQLLGPTGSEGRLLGVVAAFEEATAHDRRRPDLARLLEPSAAVAEPKAAHHD